MVAPFSGAGIPVRPDRIEGAEGPNEGNEEDSCAPTETDCTHTEIDDDEDAATTVIDEDEEEKKEVKIEEANRANTKGMGRAHGITLAI